MSSDLGHASESTATGAQDRLRSALVSNVEVVVETHLGARLMTVAQLNALSVADVIELDALLNDPVELRVNGVAVGHGELVAVGDKFAVRITSIAP